MFLFCSLGLYPGLQVHIKLPSLRLVQLCSQIFSAQVLPVPESERKENHNFYLKATADIERIQINVSPPMNRIDVNKIINNDWQLFVPSASLPFLMENGKV